MRDARRAFSDADLLESPDLWEEARRRSEHPAPLPPDRSGPTSLRRFAVATVALAVFTSSGVLVWQALRPSEDAGGRPPATEPTVAPSPASPFVDFANGWTELPAPPEVRSGAATAWTGSQLLQWGGYLYSGFSNEVSDQDGFAFDAATRTWQVLPLWPLEPRSFPASAWTGSEFVVWGGWDLDETFFGNGAAYDPVADSWRPLPPAPIDGRMPFFVWTGDELIVWGSASRDARRLDGAAYDPASDTWRSIAEAPIELTDGTAVWTGEEMIVFGAALHGGNRPETETAIGAAYDPSTDAWRRLPDSELSPQASTAAWNGTAVIAWDYLNGSAAYDPTTDSWRDLPRVPLDDVECVPQSVATSAGFVFGDYCGATVLFDPGENAWRAISEGELAGWVVELAVADPVVLLLGHDVESRESRTFAYRPVSQQPQGPAPPVEPTPFVPEVTVQDGMAHVDVTFPDGSEATLSYPEELALADGGVQPDVSYVRLDDPPPRYPILFLHGPPGVEAPFVEGTPRTQGLPATLWDARETQFTRHREIDRWLAFRTTGWTVLVSLAANADAEEVALALAVVDTETGFPVITAQAPLALAEGFGESEGPVLTFPDTLPEPDRVSGLDATVFLAPDPCSGGPDFAANLGYYGANCLGDGQVFASIYGDAEFVHAVLDGLRVESFTPTST